MKSSINWDQIVNMQMVVEFITRLSLILTMITTQNLQHVYWFKEIIKIVGLVLEVLPRPWMGGGGGVSPTTLKPQIKSFSILHSSNSASFRLKPSPHVI